jgi:hypothetical protein
VGELFLTEDCTEGQLGAYALALPKQILSSAKQDFRTSGLLANHLPDKRGTQDADDTVLNWVLSFFNCLWTRGL